MIFPPRVRYGICIVIELAQHEGRVSIREIAERQGLNRKYIEQIVADLRKGGFLRSTRGVLGGYTLARLADEITVGEIVRCLDTPNVPPGEPEDRRLALGFEKILVATWRTLDRITVAEVVGKRRR